MDSGTHPCATQLTSQWTFFVPYTCYVVGLGSYQYMNLWLASTTEYSNSTSVNVIPTGGYGLSIVMSIVYSWTSDAIGSRWPILLVGSIPPIIGNSIVRHESPVDPPNTQLASWPASDSAKFAGFFLNFTVTPIGAIMLTWANEMLSESAEARAITLGFLNTAAYVFNAWAPNLIFPASDAPQYVNGGYKVTAVFFGVFFVGVGVIWWLWRHKPVTKFREAYQDGLVVTGKAEEYVSGQDKPNEEDLRGATIAAAAVEPRAAAQA